VQNPSPRQAARFLSDYCRPTDVWRGMLDALRERLNPHARRPGRGLDDKKAKRLPSLEALALGLGVAGLALVGLAVLAAQAVPALAPAVAGTTLAAQEWAGLFLVVAGLAAAGIWALRWLLRMASGWCRRGRELRLGLRTPWPLP
jgi:uncharacterized membrane protein YqjE